MLTQRPKGTNDFLPGDTRKWQYVEEVLRKVCREYGYGEVRVPIFEHFELFTRGVGETTDIVQKEMYKFTDLGGREVALRPEGTASAVRAFVENKAYADAQPTKWYYMGPMFRYDKPQAGRYRQFHQFGVEVFGSDDPGVDAEVISMAVDIYGRLGVKNLEVHINSVGCPTCRKTHRDTLLDFLKSKEEQLCKLCLDRKERNPLRVLDCKVEQCQAATQGAPTTTTCLCEDCRTHFEAVKGYLDALGINYVVDERLVRGLDYYTKTAFEIMAQDIGAQASVCGGGRYNGLIGEVGGKDRDMPGIGFALGMERLLLTMANQGVEFPEEGSFDVFIATIGDKAKQAAFKLLADLRKAGFVAEKDYLNRSLKAQMKYADRFKAKFTIIIGDDELEQGLVTIKSMETGQQEQVNLAQVLDLLQG